MEKTCDICHVKFNPALYPLHLKTHKTKENLRKTIVCPFSCGRFFGSLRVLRKHIQKDHNSQELYIDEGPVSFNNPAVLKNGVWVPAKSHGKVGSAYEASVQLPPDPKQTKLPGGGKKRKTMDFVSDDSTLADNSPERRRSRRFNAKIDTEGSKIPSFLVNLRVPAYVDPDSFEKVDLYDELQYPRCLNLGRSQNNSVRKKLTEEEKKKKEMDDAVQFAFKYTSEIKDRALPQTQGFLPELRCQGEGEFVQEADDDDEDLIEDPVDSPQEYSFQFNLDEAMVMLIKIQDDQSAPPNQSRREFLRWYLAPTRTQSPFMRALREVSVKILLDYLPYFATRKINHIIPATLMKQYKLDNTMIMEVVRIVSLGIESGLPRIWIHQRNQNQLLERKLAYELTMKDIFKNSRVRQDFEDDPPQAEEDASKPDKAPATKPKNTWQVGDLVKAKDSFNQWLSGVVKKKDDINGKRVLVAFHGYSEKWDAWYLNNSKWLKPDIKVA